jgi:hypothetical protein
VLGTSKTSFTFNKNKSFNINFNFNLKKKKKKKKKKGGKALLAILNRALSFFLEQKSQ